MPCDGVRLQARLQARLQDIGMPRLLYFYLAKKLFLSALLIETSLCVPVVMTSLFHYLPATAVRSGLLIPALLGTFPTVTYIALPMAVGIAVAVEFSRMASEGMIAVLYSLRLSAWAIARPAIAVALIAVVCGYWISSFLAPTYVGQMHDVIYVIRNSLNHRMLEPAQFYSFDEGERTLYFQRWKSDDVVSGMFIHQFSSEKNEEQIISAREAEFRRNAHGVLLIMSHGTVESVPAGTTDMRTVDFEQHVLQINMQGTGGLPKRNWVGVFELPWLKFFQYQPIAEEDQRQYSEWMSEATKRVGIPLMALAHTLFAIGLVLTLSSTTGRGAAALTALAAIPLAHIAILIGSESLVRQDPRLVVVIGLAILTEFIAAVILISRQQAKFAVSKRKA
jgi:lipopolysaccharide export system permease protein